MDAVWTGASETRGKEYRLRQGVKLQPGRPRHAPHQRSSQADRVACSGTTDGTDQASGMMTSGREQLVGQVNGRRVGQGSRVESKDARLQPELASELSNLVLDECLRELREALHDVDDVRHVHTNRRDVLAQLT